MITDNLEIKYEVPEKYKEIIDDNFLNLFIKKLFVYDPDTFEPYPELDEEGEKIEQEVTRMDDGIIIFNELNLEGTGIWYDTLKEICSTLHKEELLDYYNKLPWYDSDLFDDYIGTQMAKKIVEKQEWKEKER